jgi:UDP-glucose 4-epimerase
MRTHLDVPGMKALLLKLPFMQRIARGEQVVAED